MALAPPQSLLAKPHSALPASKDESSKHRSFHHTLSRDARSSHSSAADVVSSTSNSPPPISPEDGDNNTILSLLLQTATPYPSAADLDTSYDPANIRHLAHFSSTHDSPALRALVHARHKAYRTATLHIPARNFRTDMQGAVVPRPARPCAAHTVNARTIREMLAWYFDVTFASACAEFAEMMQCGPRAPDFPRGALGAVLHPCALEMVGAVVKVVGEMDGRLVTPGEMREVVLRALGEWEGDEEVLGLAAVARDLAWVVAVGFAEERLCTRLRVGERVVVLEFPEDGGSAKVLRR